jgi:hypothetical protein
LYTRPRGHNPELRVIALKSPASTDAKCNMEIHKSLSESLQMGREESWRTNDGSQVGDFPVRINRRNDY